jgi:predicted P-loop ATPase
MSAVDADKIRASAAILAGKKKKERANDTHADWRAQLEPSGLGFSGDERNILIALRSAPELTKLVRFNEFALKVEFTRSPPWRAVAEGSAWEEADDTELAAWLQRQNLKVRGTVTVANCVPVAARDRLHHPVREFLNALVWDGKERVHNWAREYLGAVGDERYLCAIAPAFLISAVARIFKPGCQADHVLVLEAPQGWFKSSAVQALAMRDAWYCEKLPDIHSKDAMLQLGGRWIIELAELNAIRGSQLEAVKSFLTSRHDTFRPPYGRRSAQIPRQCVFIGTTNETEYLRDRTGNRRYWPVRCGRRIDIDAVLRDREQLWAEAVQLYLTGSPWHLTREESELATMEQAERVHRSELEMDVAAYLNSLRQNGTTTTTVRDVLLWGLRLDPDKPGYVEVARKLGPAIAEAIEQCGWRKDRRTRKESEDGQKRTLYRLSGQGGQGK